VFADLSAGLLFAGDHVLPSITPSIGFEPEVAEQPLGDYLASLVKVRALPDLVVLPAHGHVTDSSHARIDELLKFHDARLDQCRAVVSAASCTAFDVTRGLSWTRHERTVDELDLFNSVLAIMETKAHLDLLVARGTLRRVDAGDVYTYSVPA
jgi:glyoxylase-like metal-dependent hydrolase (beta-lactamase superfamily II)